MIISKRDLEILIQDTAIKFYLLKPTTEVLDIINEWQNEKVNELNQKPFEVELLKLNQEVFNEAGILKHVNVNSFGYSEIERKLVSNATSL